MPIYSDSRQWMILLRNAVPYDRRTLSEEAELRHGFRLAVNRTCEILVSFGTGLDETINEFASGCTALRLEIFAEWNFNAPFVDISQASPTETITDDLYEYSLSVPVSSRFVSDAIEALGFSEDGIRATGRLTYTLAGQVGASRPFPLILDTAL